MDRQSCRSRLQKQPTIVSEFFKQKTTQMEDSLEDFQDKKKFNKPLLKSTKKPQKRIIKKPKGQKDIRTVLKKNNLVEYTTEFRNVCLNSGVDVDSEQLQIAIALSKSLNELNQPDETKASEPHQSRDVADDSNKNRATKIRNTLLEYGFSVPEIRTTKLREVGKRVRKNRQNTKLLTTSAEEKRQKISDKVSQILFNVNTSTNDTPKSKFCEKSHTYLHKLSSEEYTILKDDSCFYVSGLVDIASNTTGCLLKDWSQIPGRPDSPSTVHREHVNFLDLIDSQDDLDVLLSSTAEVVAKLIELKEKVQSKTRKEYYEEIYRPERITLDKTHLLLPNCDSFESMHNMKASAVKRYSPDLFDDEPSVNLVTICPNILNSELITTVEHIKEDKHCFNRKDESLIHTTTHFSENVSNSCKSFQVETICASKENLEQKTKITMFDTTDNSGISSVLDPRTENQCVDSNVNIDLTQSSNSSINSLPCVHLSENTSKPDSIEIYDDNDREVSRYCSDVNNKRLQTPNYSNEFLDKIDLTEENCYLETRKIENSVTTVFSNRICYSSSKNFTQEIIQITEKQEPRKGDNIDLTQSICSSPLCENFCQNNLEDIRNLEKNRYATIEIPNITSDLSSKKCAQNTLPLSENEKPEIDDKIDQTQSLCSQQSAKFHCNYVEDITSCNSDENITTETPNIICNLSCKKNSSKIIAIIENEERKIDDKIDLTQSSCSPQSEKCHEKYLEDMENYHNDEGIIVGGVSFHSKNDSLLEDKTIEYSNFSDNKINEKMAMKENLDKENIFTTEFKLSSNDTHKSLKDVKLNSTETEIITEHPIFNDEILSQCPMNAFEISDEELDYSMQYFRKEKRKSSRNSKISINFGVESPYRIPDLPSTSKCLTPKHSLLRRTKSLGLEISLPEVEIKGIKTTSPLTKCPSTPNSPRKKLDGSTLVTPGNTEYIVKLNNITPLVDYASMDTPKVHKELEKYGIRPFKRKRAVQLLEHLYYQTHPIMEYIDSDDENETKKLKNNQDDCEKRKPTAESDPKDSSKETSRENKEIYEETKFEAKINEIVYEETDLIFQKKEKAKIQSCKVPLHIAFHNYLHARPLLRSAILRYQPISIDIVHKQLVKDGHRYDPKDLLRFMDNKCITIKTSDSVKNGGKRTKKRS